jgi:type IV pilus assembly protein PilV
MQALALSSTSVSRLRSLAAIEAASLASAMHANRAYWAAATLTQPIVVTGATATTSDANLTAALATVNGASGDYCISGAGAPCLPVTMAGADLQAWATELNTMLPNASARITCPTTTTPLNCTILIDWTENAVAINKQTANAPATNPFQTPTYTLFVEP